MTTLSSISQEKSTQKRTKVSRTRLEIANKVAAFQELTSLNQKKKTARKAAEILEIPNSTMQYWTEKKGDIDQSALAEFFSTPSGSEFLQRMFSSMYMVVHFGCGGIRSIQKFLKYSKLDQFIASSYGSLHAFCVKCENHIIEFGESQEKMLRETLLKKKITAGLDEMFRGRKPCLVAIEVISGYILLEKFTDDRKAETWERELKPRLEFLNLECEQVVSDLCGGIRAFANNTGAKHIPELFHAQHEITKATSGALSAHVRSFEKSLLESETKLKKVVTKKGANSLEGKEALGVYNLRKDGLAQRNDRLMKVRGAKKELGRIHHPIDLKTGKLQTAEIIKERFDEQLDIIETTSKEAGLSSSSMNRIAKSRRAFDAIIEYLIGFYSIYRAFVRDLSLGEVEKKFFDEVVFPLNYLQMALKKVPRKERKEIEKLSALEKKLKMDLQQSQYTSNQIKKWMEMGKELSEKFQRSSSCVEGRNGMLSLYFHRFHRLCERSAKALTIVHNFDLRRSDGTTAAERCFGKKHEDLFESLVAKVKIPGKPQRQHHDQEKRQLGWEKRRVA